MCLDDIPNGLFKNLSTASSMLVNNVLFSIVFHIIKTIRRAKNIRIIFFVTVTRFLIGVKNRNANMPKIIFRPIKMGVPGWLIIVDARRIKKIKRSLVIF